MGGESPTQKMVQSLKEIVHGFSEQEIQAMLEECDMDPNEAVQGLLAQDTFHEVKSKREKRKEVKETQEMKSRAVSNIWNWGANSDLDAGNFSNAYKRENGSVTSSLSRSSYASHPAAKAVNQKSGHSSVSFNGENRREPKRAGNTINSSLPTGLVTGRTSTADNVKGDSQQKVSPGWTEAPSYLQDVVQQSEGYDYGHSKVPASVKPTESSSGGSSGCSHDSSEQVTPHSQSRCHPSFRDVDATKVDEGVLLPSHVQAMAAECSHLTFGTYKTHSSSTDSGISNPHGIDLTRVPGEADGPSMQQLYLTELLLKDILGSANDFSRANQNELLVREMIKQQSMGTPPGYESLPTESDPNSRYIQYAKHFLNGPASYASLSAQEVPSYSSDMLRNLKVQQSSTESSLRFLRQQNSLNSTYPPDKSRYIAAVSSIKSQTISIPEATVKFPHQLFGPSSQPNHNIVDESANWRGGYTNTPQNYGHTASVEHLHQYLVAASNRQGLPHQYNKREDHPVASLAPSSIDASGFGSFLPNTSVASNVPPCGYDNILQTQFTSPGQIGSNTNTAWDYGARSGAIPNSRQDLGQQFGQKYGYLGNGDVLR